MMLFGATGHLQHSICEVRFKAKHSAQVPANEFTILKTASSKDAPTSPRDGRLTDIHPVGPLAKVQLLDCNVSKSWIDRLSVLNFMPAYCAPEC